MIRKMLLWWMLALAVVAGGPVWADNGQQAKGLALGARNAANAAAQMAQLRGLRLRDLAPLYSTNHTLAPTITVTSGNNSAVNGQFYSTPTVPWTDSRISYVGRVAQLGTSGTTVAFAGGIDTNYGAAANHPIINGNAVNSDFMRARFMSDAPTFDLVVRSVGGLCNYDLWIDGQPMYRAGQPIIASGSANFIKVDWGADVPKYGFGLIGISQAGTGYVVGEDVTMDTGAVLRIAAIGTNGIVTGAVIKSPGAYAAPVATTSAQASTTGAGTGLVVTPTQEVVSHTTRKMHTYEFRLKGTANYGFAGINVPISPIVDTVLAWPAPGPVMVGFGDSTMNDIFGDGPGLSFMSVACERLGVENCVTSGAPSTGWVVSAGALTIGQRLPTDLDPLAPTDPSKPFVAVFNAGINDNAQSPAAVQSAVQAAISGAIARNPNLRVVVFGPWQGYLDNGLMESIEAAMQAGVSSARGCTPTRCAFVPVLKKWLVPNGGKVGLASSSSGNSSIYISQDGTHQGRATNEFLGANEANALLNVFTNWGLQIGALDLRDLPPWWQNGRINPAYRAREVVAG